MKMTSILATAALAGALLAAPQARADILLDLVNPPDQTNTPYSLSFTAGGPVTTISIGGYQWADWEQTASIGLFSNGRSVNLLGYAWTSTPAAPLFSAPFDDGTSVQALAFSTNGLDYDTFSQTVATTAGQSYSLNFLYTNDVFGNGPTPSGLLVTETATTGVPEPSTWILMLLTLKPSRTQMSIDGQTIPLTPGMAVSVEIATGNRRILEYIFSPLVETASQAMEER